jgi:hypothetical protein
MLSQFEEPPIHPHDPKPCCVVEKLLLEDRKVTWPYWATPEDERV